MDESCSLHAVDKDVDNTTARGRGRGSRCSTLYQTVHIPLPLYRTQNVCDTSCSAQTGSGHMSKKSDPPKTKPPEMEIPGNQFKSQSGKMANLRKSQKDSKREKCSLTRAARRAAVPSRRGGRRPCPATSPAYRACASHRPRRTIPR